MPRLLRVPWSLQFVYRHLRYMSAPSAVRFRNYVLRRERNQCRPGELLRLRMRAPFAGNVWLREYGADSWTFGEVVTDQVYCGVIRQVPQARYIVDLGANIGLASRLFAAAYPSCSILAVEPDPDNVGLLRRNLHELMTVGRCQIEQAAVWDRTALVGLECPDGNGAYNAYRVGSAGPSGPAQLVQGFTMGDLLRRCAFPQIDLLKIDVEGAEVEVFRGDLRWLDSVLNIAIEFHHDSRRRSTFDELMDRHGFVVEDALKHTVIARRRRRALSAAA